MVDQGGTHPPMILDLQAYQWYRTGIGDYLSAILASSSSSANQGGCGNFTAGTEEPRSLAEDGYLTVRWVTYRVPGTVSEGYMCKTTLRLVIKIV